MNVDSADQTMEPDLWKFEAEYWEFPDEETRAEYVDAVEDLRAKMRAEGVQEIHARLLGQPTAETVRAIARTIGRMKRPTQDPHDSPVPENSPTTEDPAAALAWLAEEPEFVVDERSTRPRRRWWHRKP